MSPLSLFLSKTLKHKLTHFPLPCIPLSLFFSTHAHKPTIPLPTTLPPTPKKLPHKVTLHGHTWDDPYHWMSNTKDPDFVTYLTQENAYSEAFMADTVEFRKEVAHEMSARLPARIDTPPEKWGPWLYYQYVPEGKDYPVLCRRLGAEESSLFGSLLSHIRKGFKREEILLDWNEIAEKYGYVHVGACRVSPDHNFLAYTLDTVGSEKFFLQIKDLRDGHIIPNIEADSVVSLAWAQDGSLFYTMSDENQRPCRVLYSDMRSGVDRVIFTEDDSRFCVDITSTKDGKFITVNSSSRTSSEVYIIDASEPLGSLRKVHKRIEGVQYFLEHHCGLFYILTNCPIAGVEKLHPGNFYLVISRVEDVDNAKWQNIILPREDTSLRDIDIFDKHLVMHLDRDGSSFICSVNLPMDINCKHVLEIEDLNAWVFPVPSDLCLVVPGSNHDYMSSAYRVVLSSPVMPDLMVEYDMSNRTCCTIHQEEVLGSADNSLLIPHKFHVNGNVEQIRQQGDESNESQIGYSTKYACERHEVVSHDGVKIPLTIVYSRHKWDQGQSPVLLEAYGAYGEVLDKSWCPDRLSLLDRGWVVAFADVRGGGGCDPSWHQRGRGVDKVNSIYDFISCAKYMIAEGYAPKDKLAATGTSAGSLLVGAAICLQPDLFRCAIMKVPFVDICNTLMDSSLPLTILDYEEFGNPNVQTDFESIMKYSPYDNIVEGSCSPALLVTAAFNDSRVGVWEAAKWVSKVRDKTCTTCSRAVILKTDMNGGHFGEGGRFGHSQERAYEYAFLMKVMGLLDKSRK